MNISILSLANFSDNEGTQLLIRIEHPLDGLKVGGDSSKHQPAGPRGSPVRGYCVSTQE